MLYLFCMDTGIPNFSELPHEKHSHLVGILSICGVIALSILGYVVYLNMRDVPSEAPAVTKVEKQIPLEEQREELSPIEAEEKRKALQASDTSQIKLSPKESKQKKALLKQTE